MFRCFGGRLKADEDNERVSREIEDLLRKQRGEEANKTKLLLLGTRALSPRPPLCAHPTLPRSPYIMIYFYFNFLSPSLSAAPALRARVGAVLI